MGGQGAQQSVERFGVLFPSGRSNSATSIPSVGGSRDPHALQSVATKAEPSFHERLERQLAAWRRNSSWVDETPALEVGNPKNPRNVHGH